MPTPDTEALAARLRAVERALTDDGTTLEAAADDERSSREAPDNARRDPAEDAPADTPLPDGERGPADGVRTDGAGTGVERRLARLEAAVQALRAALGAEGKGSGRSIEPEADVEPPEAVTASAATRATERTRSRPTGRPDRDWPDDLSDGA